MQRPAVMDQVHVEESKNGTAQSFTHPTADRLKIGIKSMRDNSAAMEEEDATRRRKAKEGDDGSAASSHRVSSKMMAQVRPIDDTVASTYSAAVDTTESKGDDSGSSSTNNNSEEEEGTSGLDREVRRLQVLKKYLGVLDDDSSGHHWNSFERLTTLASRIVKSPMAAISLVDLDKQYVIASRGDNWRGTRKSPFCSYIISKRDCDVLVVLDAAKDERFAKDLEVDNESSSPDIRFYAGAPLVSPEGYTLGTFCVMDSKPRTETLSLEEKQCLMEFAEMAMETLSQLREKKYSALKDPAQQIACTAHDLLTPLTGIVLSLSLLKEDELLQQKLTEQQRDMVDTAANCSAVMNSICQQTMEVFRDQDRKKKPQDLLAMAQSMLEYERHRGGSKKMDGPPTVKVAHLVKNLNMVMEPYPKQVPLIITVDPSVPPEIVGDDMKIFRSAANFLSNSCAMTESGSIHFRIYTREADDDGEELVFECTDTGIGVDPAAYQYLFKPVNEVSDPLRISRSRQLLGVPKASRAAMRNSGLGLYSVATQISSIGGKYGFRPRNDPSTRSHENEVKSLSSGSVFWFCIPLVLPHNHVSTNTANSNDIPLSNNPGQPNTALSGKKRRRLAELPLPSKKSDSQGDDTARLPKTASNRTLSSENVTELFGSRSNLGAMDFKNRSFPTNSTRKRYALVIEDSLVVRKSLARALEKLEFEVTQVVNGMDGLKELQANLFDLVLCDFLMPKMDGLDCVQQYRAWEANNRPYFRQYIIGISAHASQKDIEQGKALGMDDFRSKPVTYKELMSLKNGPAFKKASRELDSMEYEIENHKRKKLEHPADESLEGNCKVCLVIDDSSVASKLAEIAAEGMNWKIVSVNEGSSALGLLKMRNWDAVLVDDGSKNARCIATFREWEHKHRVNRQSNVVLMTSSYIGLNESRGASSSFQVPTPFDDAIGKPFDAEIIRSVIRKAEVNAASSGHDIVLR